MSEKPTLCCYDSERQSIFLPAKVCGIIRNDSFECVVLSVEGGHDKQKPRTEVTVEEIGEE